MEKRAKKKQDSKEKSVPLNEDSEKRDEKELSLEENKETEKNKEKNIDKNEKQEKFVYDSEKYDAFGFLIEKEDDLPPKEKKLRKAEAKKEHEREKKWAEMFQKNDWRKMDERIMKGIPNVYRGEVWKRIIDPDSQNSKDASERYSVAEIIPDLSKEEWGTRYRCWKTIDDDVTRTMPDNGRFMDPKLRKSLQSVLRAYSVYDNELGFTQGMSFYAALLLLYMDEKSAYYCFRALMFSPKYMIRNFFTAEFPQLYKLKIIWNFLLSEKYPKVSKNIEEVDFVMYATEWFLTAFLRTRFPMQLKLRIFDRYIAFGTRALISFGMVIISRNKDILSKCDFDTAIMTLQSCADLEQMSDWRYLMKKYDQHWISEKEYEKLFAKTGVEYFP